MLKNGFALHKSSQLHSKEKQPNLLASQSSQTSMNQLKTLNITGDLPRSSGMGGEAAAGLEDVEPSSEAAELGDGILGP